MSGDFLVVLRDILQGNRVFRSIAYTRAYVFCGTISYKGHELYLSSLIQHASIHEQQERTDQIRIFSNDSTNDLLFQSWLRALQISLQGSEDEPPVSLLLTNASCLPGLDWPLIGRLHFRDLAAFQRYTQPVVNAIRNPTGLLNRTTNTASTTSSEALLNRIRNVNRQQLVSAGVVGAEVLGFFTVGEMLGKAKLVGYRGDTAHHETATPL